MVTAMRARGSLYFRLSPIGNVVGLGLGLVWSTLVSCGSELVTHIGDYTIQNWQLEQGLPQISVTSIAQTPDGYLWVGTFNGLARFDGVRFTVFHEGNTPTLGSSAILQLQVDAQGALWIVTLTDKLVRMAGGQFTLVPKINTPLLLGDGEFSDNRRLVVGDRTTQPWHWWQVESGQLVPLASANRSQASDEPRFLFENSGVTWLLQQNNLTSSSKQKPLSFLACEGSNSKRIELAISSAAPSQSGGYWLATETGIHRLLQGRLSTWVAPVPLETEQVSLKEDGHGNLWAGKWGQGVFRMNPDGSWQKFSAGTGLADNHVNCLFRDREGNLWVGTGQGGLHRIRPRVFQMYDTESGPNVVMSVTQDRQGRMWFGVNGGGLQTWAEGKLRPVAEPAALHSYPLAFSVLADRQDALWVGLYGLMVLRWHADAVAPYDLNDGSGQPMTPHALFEDRAGTVWLGCAHGLLRDEGGRFTRYTVRDGLSCETVVALAQNKSGTLYVGTDGGGVNSLRQGRFTHFTEREGLSDNHVTSLYLDKEETLWIGTVHGGLCRLKQGCLAAAGLKDGLPTETIGSLLEDDRGHLWLGSNRGILRVNRLALNDYLDGKQSSVAWHIFGLSDGLSTVGCGAAGQPASCKAQDGRLWFATIKGVAVVNPNQIPLNQLPPPVVIEEVAIDDQVQYLRSVGAQPEAANSMHSSAAVGFHPAAAGVPSGSRIAPDELSAAKYVPGLTAPPRTRRVEFRFTGLSLVAAEKVRFRYRLSGLDKDWREAGSERSASYNYVPPGNYRFEVTACNNDGVWNLTGAALGLAVLPPWWMTWWFRILAVVGIVGLVLGWYEQRLRRLRRERVAQETFSRQLIASQETERRRLAGELHDGLGQDLLVIASQAQLSLTQPEIPSGVAARLKDIAQTARQAIQQARHMAHNLRPGLLEELGLSKAIRACADKVAQASGISVAITLDEVDGLLPAEYEVNLFRIAQETLNNVIKHSSATEVEIRLTRQPTSLRLVVEDKGNGFDLARLHAAQPDQRGFGLRQIAERAKLMGGRLDLRSHPGRGTRVTVDVPLPDSRFHP